ncbi:MAG: DoxX family membrane protein [Rubrobacter sp.]|nr:DoxX family membrane protein [Rubrobacter sp.]
MVSAVNQVGEDNLSVVRRALSNPYVSLVSRLVLGGLFLYAGAAKVFDPGGLASSIRGYELSLPEWFVSLSAHSLPLLEILLGLYLVVGLFTRTAAWVANLLTILFTLALLQGALRGLEIDCGCFGSTAGGSTNLWMDVVRDLGFLVVGLQLAYAPPGKFSLDARLRQQKT